MKRLYADPDTHFRTGLPIGYSDAWTNGTDYVMSNDARFDPNTQSTGNWRRLTPQN